MGKKLAIKGHPTRGKEVIKLLEMLGGINDRGYIGTNSWKDEYYFLDNGYIRAFDWCDGIKYTLEEFLEKYPFKVGDKVMDYHRNSLTIKSMSWSEDCETTVYDFEESNAVLTTEDLLKWNTVDSFKNGVDFFVTEMPRRMDIEEASFRLKHMILPNKINDNLEYDIIDGYEFDRVENGKIILKPIKPKYPTTYEECCEIIHSDPNFYIDTHLYSGTLETLYKLLICRNAYWKMVGEEMGLDKPWEPDWNDEIQKYCIRMDRNKIVNCSSSFNNRILAFPQKRCEMLFMSILKI